MGKLLFMNNSSSSSAMDIDPRVTPWNQLCPNFNNLHRTKLLQDQSSGHAIGSPPPAGPPKVMWNEQGNVPAPKESQDAMDTADLASKVQEMRLQPPQPMIICETVEDVKVTPSENVASSSVSLSVPVVDLSNEKKRPPY